MNKSQHCKGLVNFSIWEKKYVCSNLNKYNVAIYRVDLSCVGGSSIAMVISSTV